MHFTHPFVKFITLMIDSLSLSMSFASFLFTNEMKPNVVDLALKITLICFLRNRDLVDQKI
jgi:hypothetical protein